METTAQQVSVMVAATVIWCQAVLVLLQVDVTLRELRLQPTLSF